MTLTDVQYISIGRQHDPNIEENRRTAQIGEVLRIYYKDRKFMFMIRNKKKDMAGYADAANIVRLVKNKYSKGKVCDLNFCYPDGFKNQAKVKALVNEHVDEANFEKFLYKYLLLLV
jgi:hypothetical protein